MVGQHHARERRRTNAGQFDDPQPLQRAAHALLVKASGRAGLPPSLIQGTIRSLHRAPSMTGEVEGLDVKVAPDAGPR
jgi:hypothetical protein